MRLSESPVSKIKWRRLRKTQESTSSLYRDTHIHVHMWSACIPHYTPIHCKKKTLIKKKIRKKNPVVVEVKGIAPVSLDAICELEWEASLDRWRVLPWPHCVKGFYHFTWILSLSLLCLTPLPINSSPLSLCALGLWTLKAFIKMLFLEKVKEKAFPDDPPCILLPCK